MATKLGSISDVEDTLSTTETRSISNSTSIDTINNTTLGTLLLVLGFTKIQVIQQLLVKTV